MQFLLPADSIVLLLWHQFLLMLQGTQHNMYLYRTILLAILSSGATTLGREIATYAIRDFLSFPKLANISSASPCITVNDSRYVL